MAKKKTEQIEQQRRPRATRPTNPKSILMTLSAAAFELGWPKATLYGQVTRGALPVISVGKRKLWVRRSDIEALLNSRTERRDA